MINFDYDIKTIFVMLGFACNFRCKYCLQHENKIMKKEDYNPDIIEFIKQVASKQEEDVKVHFFGGEPFLYFDIIKDFVEQLKGYNVRFSTITNGSLITEEIANFLVEHRFNVGISWDGRNTKLSRGIDVFETNKENIFKLKRGFGISGVLNKYNSIKTFLEDVEKIDNEFKEYTHTPINIGHNLDCLYNSTHSTEEIYDINYELIDAEMKDLAYNFIHNPEKNKPIENNYINEFINQIRGYEEYDEELENKSLSPYCGNGVVVLNMDLQGNLYLCHNDSNTTLGTIYDTYEEYFTKYKEKNPIPYFYKKYCKDCLVRFICNGGCMLCDEEERLTSFCLQKKARFSQLIMNILSLVE